jgi:hypothetical protein
MSYESGYFWIVLCKNHKFHKVQNILFEHRIPLAETDPYETPPESFWRPHDTLRQMRRGICLSVQGPLEN